MSNPHPLDAAARDFTPISADEAQSFLAHARKDFTSEDNELGYVPVQPCDLERLSLTILALLASVRGAEADSKRLDWLEAALHPLPWGGVYALIEADGEDLMRVTMQPSSGDAPFLNMARDTLRAALDAARSATPTRADDAE